MYEAFGKVIYKGYTVYHVCNNEDAAIAYCRKLNIAAGYGDCWHR